MTATQKSGHVWRNVKMALVIALVVLVLIVIFQNVEQASYRILFWQLRLPRIAFALLAFGAGALASGLTLLAARKRK
jgi:uncharacterized integral membrane protein